MAKHYKYRLRKPPRIWERAAAKLISGTRMSKYNLQLTKALELDPGINPLALQQWRLGWLSYSLPEEDIATLMVRGMKPAEAAVEIREMISPYNTACQEILGMFTESQSGLIAENQVPLWILEDWILDMCVGGPVAFVKRHSVSNMFDRTTAASEMLGIINELHAAWTLHIKEVFDEAERKRDLEDLHLRADAASLKAREVYLKENGN